ncbi:importin-11-like [Limulus polyphemus]|uniref:Importin-11-like n=1 Tax=Limulus polyphemus TaxID=6850 RepID=A0ABM1BF59_LIMPO|nr:importin-11-like [Limulus polyphemus]
MNPEFTALVLNTLRNASNQDAQLLKPAEQQLRLWETQPGFYSTLLAIFSNYEIEVNVRWLAVLYFKNGVDRYWRRNAPNAISEEEKTVLRQNLLSNFSEPVHQLAVQLAVLIAKIARFDCPKEWQELLPRVLEAVRNKDELYQERALLTLYHVVKALSSKRLAADRRMFYDLTLNIFNYILYLWDNHTQQILHLISQKDFNLSASLEKSLLSLRVLRKLIVHGMKSPHEVEDAVRFMSLVFHRIPEFLHCRKAVEDRNNLRELIQKSLIVLTKALHDVLELHPFSFVQFIRSSLDCTVSLCFTPAGEGLLFERFRVQCLNLIKGILFCPEYKPAKVIEETKEPATLEAHRIKMEFFTYSTLTEICRRLLTNYFLLTEEDLDSWDNDPEEFATDEGGETWKFSLRPCTEVLFLTLFHEFRQTLTPLILDMVQKVTREPATEDMRSILQKDAVYNAVGLAAFELFDDIDFDNWFLEVLLQELKLKTSSYRIIRRRVTWLIGQWVGVKLSPELRPILYEALLPLLDEQEDLVVRLAAANTLKYNNVKLFLFFLQYLESSVGLLYTLLEQANECDTKMTVLHVLSFIIERVGSQIRPHAAALVRYLPHLWDMSSHHNMLRCAIISTLVHLVQGLGTLSEKLQSFLLPVIAHSTDVNEPPHVYLLEDGLDLWWAVIENSPGSSPDLLQLAGSIFPLLELGSENLRTCLHIVQGYILLAPQEFLQNYGQNLVSSCCSMITDIRPEGMVLVMRCVEVVLRVFPEEGSDLFHPLLSTVLSSLLQNEDFPMVASMYLSLLARVILHNQRVFAKLLQDKASEKGQQTEEVLSSMLDIWLEKMPLVHPVERRKLLGLALTSMITSNVVVIHDRFCGLLLAVNEVLNDIIRTDDPEAMIDSLVLTNSDELHQDHDEETEHDKRKRELSIHDPVHTVALREYLCTQMNAIQQSLGQSTFEQLMSTVDAETLQQLKEYIRA